MNQQDKELLSRLWPRYFPKDKFWGDDKRIGAVEMFIAFFQSESGKELVPANITCDVLSVEIDIPSMQRALPFSDFVSMLQTRPKEVIGCIGIALSIIFAVTVPAQKSLTCIPRFVGLTTELSFGELKSGTVGQLVAIRGYVVRASHCRPLIEGALFSCGKCFVDTFTYFEDGIFQPPPICPTKKCYNKFLDIQRSTVISTDCQRVKLQVIKSVV